MIVEPEFARALIVMNRPDNILSSVIRTAWDQDRLHVMTRKPLEVTGAHISIIGHITTDELKRRLNATELANGFANRFLFALVRQARLLPFGGAPIDYEDVASELNAAQAKAQEFERMSLAESFNAIWPEQYERLIANASRPGMFGAITSRGPAHVRRLAMIYALLDRTPLVTGEHLRAALEVWRYCEDSIRCIFGASLGDDTADTILNALQGREDGLTRTDIFRGVFLNNKNSSEIRRALDMLEREKLVTREQQGTNGRPKEIWRALNTPNVRTATRAKTQ